MFKPAFAALALVALASTAEARPLHKDCNVTMPCDAGGLLSGVRSIKVTMKRVKHVAGPKRESPVRRRHVAQARSEYRPRNNINELAVTPSTSGLVDRARQYMGQTAAQIGLRRSLWCSAFLRHVTGARGVDDRAISWLSRPRVGRQVGAIAVLRHHVGIVSGFDKHGNPILVSGNHGRRVGEGRYSAGRVLAYVSAS